ncbi:hypothetical protein [uncultured Nostoc sp.]|uniref:hypothetical protein n=1 Tax=uncultured Nostoc sp. TaxID=340711 RepID=UPI0035CAAEB5
MDNRCTDRFKVNLKDIYPSSVTLREGDRYKPYEAINTSYTIRKKSVLYLLLENNRAIAGYTKALEFRNGKSFRRVTEEG